MIDAIGGVCFIAGLVLFFSAAPLIVIWRHRKQSRRLNIMLTVAVISVNTAWVIFFLSSVRMYFLREFYHRNLKIYAESVQSSDEARLPELTRELKEHPRQMLPPQSKDTK